MDSVVASTVVYVEPREVYEFLVDFEGYAGYSEYLKTVTRDGDGTAGTVYEITVGWWRIDHTVRSEVTAVDPPSRIDWRLLGSVGARGAWRVQSLSDADPPETVPDLATTSGNQGRDGERESDDPPANGPATLVSLEVDYDPDTVDGEGLDLPRFVSVDFVVDRVEPLVREEAERVVERIVADLEGEQRSVSLHVGSEPVDTFE